MIIEREKLLSVLKTVKKGLGKSPKFTQSEDFVFRSNYVMSYNDTCSVLCPFQFDYECAVPGEELLNILNKLKQPEITIEVTEKEFVIKAGKSKTIIYYDSNLTLPFKDLSTENLNWYEFNHNEFIPALKMASDVSSTSVNEPLLRMICVNSNGVFSTDSYRMFHYRLENPPKEQFFVSASMVSCIDDFKPVAVAYSAGWLVFKNLTQSFFAVRSIKQEEEFPVTPEFFNMDGNTFTVPKEISDMVDKAMVFLSSKNEDDCVIYHNKNKKMLLMASGAHGKFMEQCETEAEAEFKFQISPLVLKEASQLGSNLTLCENCILIKQDKFTYLAGLTV